MDCNSLFRNTTIGFGFLLCLALTNLPALAQDNLPHPDPDFKGKIGKNDYEFKADPKLFLFDPAVTEPLATIYDDEARPPARPWRLAQSGTAPAATVGGSKAIPSTVPPDDICRPDGPCNADHNRPEHGSLGNIGAKLANPTSDLWSLTMSFNAPQTFDGDLNLGDPQVGGGVNLEPVMPFPLYGTGEDQWKLITRPIIPILFSQPTPTGFNDFAHVGGLGDIELPLLLNPPPSFTKHWILGAGPVFEFPTSTNDALGNQQFAVGPALVVGYKTKSMTAVLFPNYFFGFADRSDRKASTPTTSKLSMLYALVFNLPDAWQVGMNPTIAFDYRATSGNKWNVPVGLFDAKTMLVGRTPLNIKLGFEYSVVSQDDFGKRFMFRLQVTPVIAGLVQKPIFGGK